MRFAIAALLIVVSSAARAEDASSQPAPAQASTPAPGATPAPVTFSANEVERAMQYGMQMGYLRAQAEMAGQSIDDVSKKLKGAKSQP